MVLRDVRDTTRRVRLDRRARTGKRGDAKWAKRIKKNFKKKNRIKTKKNKNNSVTFPAKRKVIIQKKEIEVEKDVCSICCESTKNIKYINCKRGGTQSMHFGRYSECCKDKPICSDCRIKCLTCPFCKNHSLAPFKKRFPKKKAPFALRQEQIRLRKVAKEKKRKRKRPMLRVSVRRRPTGDLRVRRFIGNAPHPSATRWEMRQSRWADAPMEIISYFD